MNLVSHLLTQTNIPKSVYSAWYTEMKKITTGIIIYQIQLVYITLLFISAQLPCTLNLAANTYKTENVHQLPSTFIAPIVSSPSTLYSFLFVIYLPISFHFPFTSYSFISDSFTSSFSIRSCLSSIYSHLFCETLLSFHHGKHHVSVFCSRMY